MGFDIANAGIAVVSLDARLDGGAAWVCLQDDAGAMSCGAHETRPEASGPIWTIELGATDTNHDGFYVVGPTTASPPATSE
jgi:hypothetical protein